jgi:hypothetical protein
VDTDPVAEGAMLLGGYADQQRLQQSGLPRSPAQTSTEHEALVMVAEEEQLVVDDDSERAGECRSVVLRGPVSTLRRTPFPQNRRAV